MKVPFSNYLLQRASWFRHGIVLPYQYIPPTFSDIEGIYNFSVGMDGVIKDSVNWGIDIDEISAMNKAIGESIERYSASITRFPINTKKELHDRWIENILYPESCSLFSDEQYKNDDFPWKKPTEESIQYGEVYSLYDNTPYWIIQELIWLWSQTESPNFPSTSSGIASHFDQKKAILSALQEVLERDAFISTWTNSIWWDKIDISGKIYDDIIQRWWEIHAFEITQIWNPHPVIVVCGQLPIRGKKRYWLGAACKSTFEEAFQKAFIEWIQWVIFSWVYAQYNPELKIQDKQWATSFDLHAIYYTCNPDQFENIPLLKNSITSWRSIELSQLESLNKDSNKLPELLEILHKGWISIYYRDISSIDTSQLWLHTFRVICPELSLLHWDERQPFLWWRLWDIEWRYPQKVDQKKINPFPHFLG